MAASVFDANDTLARSENRTSFAGSPCRSLVLAVFFQWSHQTPPCSCRPFAEGRLFCCLRRLHNRQSDGGGLSWDNVPPPMGNCYRCYTDKFKHNATQSNNLFFTLPHLCHKEARMDWKYVSKQVKLARTRRNMTQDDLAAATSKHRATIARLETGNPINQGTLYAIADALKVEYSVLTGETGSLGGPPGLLDEIAPDQEDAMEHLLSQSRDLANLIVGWEVLTANEITLGQLAKAIDYSHRLKDTVDALDALGITEKKDLPPLGPPNGDPNRSPPSNTARGD